MGLALKDADFLPLADLRAVQSERWRQQAAYIEQRSGFYRALLAERSLPTELAALVDLPFTDKSMIRADQRLHPPFGSYLASPLEQITRVHRTSGTSGTAMNLALSREDAEITAQVGARAQSAAGLGPGHRVVHCLNYQLWMGGYTDHAILEATGATVIPFGVGSTAALIRTIRELGVSAISCTPSYPAVLEQVLAEQFEGLRARDLGLRLGLFGGEPGLDDPVFRERLESTWGFAARNSNYGVTDMLSTFAGQSEQCTDLHFVALDLLYPELIDPEDGAVLPWRTGESGELVLTHLAKQCQPLVRFRTGDIIVLTGTDGAACGRTAPRFRVIGRSDDMVVVRGINLFPTQVAAVLNFFAQLSGEYRIVLEHPPPYDHLPIEAELAATHCLTPGLAVAIEARVKQELGARCLVKLLAPGSLPRTAGKTRRVIRSYS